MAKERNWVQSRDSTCASRTGYKENTLGVKKQMTSETISEIVHEP